MRLVVLSVLLSAVLVGSANASLGCASCANVVHSLVRASHENPKAMALTLSTAGDSICRHAGSFLSAACSGLVGLVGEDVLLEAIETENHEQVCSDICNDESSEGDLLFVLDGSLQKDKEDTKEAKKVETDDNKKNVDSNLQDNNKEDEVKRLRSALEKSELETKAKIAAAVKEVTDKVDENTKKAVAEASAKAVEEAKEKWRTAWRSRQWPVNVKVPEVASKLACTAESEGRIAFRDQNFFGCKQHCVNVCEQCNCKQEETSVWDEEGKVYKRVKREVCEQCCSQKCAPEWLNFAKCARVCKQCDCKEDHGVKVCQQCCNEECAPAWNPDPI